MDADLKRMVAETVNAKDWVAKPLTGFAIQEMTEVYHTDFAGKRTKSIGYFRNEDVAKAFASQQDEVGCHKTTKAFVLTNGNVGFLMTNDVVNLIDDEAELPRIRERAVAKLSDGEQRVLGFL